ncbi:MAG: hypothetical protein RBS23_11575, partial [Mariniphaga sp.]|nr:hypothetical protein [Mariniphaga sp.]
DCRLRIAEQTFAPKYPTHSYMLVNQIRTIVLQPFTIFEKKLKPTLQLNLQSEIKNSKSTCPIIP